ncbi:MAG: threonine/serine exporter family protein, partial [Planctomycetes bacterium]|nr:threonine/serine exporter family protein [Planctomycetota bacterium]
MGAMVGRARPEFRPALRSAQDDTHDHDQHDRGQRHHQAAPQHLAALARTHLEEHRVVEELALAEVPVDRGELAAGAHGCGFPRRVAGCVADGPLDRQNEGRARSQSERDDVATGAAATGRRQAPGAVGRPVADPQPAIAFALKLGRALQGAGLASYRVEEALSRVCERLDVRGQFFSAPTELMYSFQVGRDEWTYMQRTEPGEVNLGRLAALEALTLDVIRGRTGPQQAAAEVDRITAARPPWGPGATLAGYALASASAAWFFGGGLAEIGLS